MTAAVYAGSFDPITNGHLGIIRAGLLAFDRVIVAVLTNPNKQALFTAEERMEMIREAVEDDPRVEIDRFEHGLLVQYAKVKGVSAVLRGLRAAGDFEYELQMANMNYRLAPDIVTVFIGATDFAFVSSSLVKEVAALGGDLCGVVPAAVEARLRERLSEKR